MDDEKQTGIGSTVDSETLPTQMGAKKSKPEDSDDLQGTAGPSSDDAGTSPEEAAEVEVRDPSDVGKPEAPSAAPDAAAAEGLSSAEDAGGPPGGGRDAGGIEQPAEPVPRRLTKKEILNRLVEKNQVILDLTKKSKQSEAQRKDLKDKWLRSVAEFENYRKRTRKEWELLKQKSKAEVILEILNVVDDFERAFSVTGGRDDEFVQGIRLIYNNLMSTLEKFGAVKMQALHQPFDPNYHMAVALVESREAEKNHVVEVIQEGYLLGDLVIRPAKVVIAK